MKTKRLTLLLLLTMTFSLLFAQTNEYAFERGFYSTPYLIEITASNKILVAMEETFEDYDYPRKPRLVVLNELGEVEWEYSDLVDSQKFGKITKILPLDDESFYIMGNVRGCDYPGGTFIYRFKEDGELIFKAELNLSPIDATLFSNEDLAILGWGLH